MIMMIIKQELLLHQKKQDKLVAKINLFLTNNELNATLKTILETNIL